MTTSDDIRWFKTQFGPKIEAALGGSVFDLDMIVAIACQETGYVWSRLRRKTLSVDRILELCVGDTIDQAGTKGRSVFPRNKAELIAAPNGQAMFNVARHALEDIAQYLPDFKGAASNPNKFCHGFGVFQRDIQFFKNIPEYFLEKKYVIFENTLAECLKELDEGLKVLRYQNKTHLTDTEFAYVAIAYNTGRFVPSKGLQQGYYDKNKYYGEYILDYVTLSRAVKVDSAVVSGAGGASGGAGQTLPDQGGTGRYVVVARSGLKVRNGPGLDFSVSQTLEVGTEVTVLAYDDPERKWARVDLQGDGLVDGHVFAAFLAPAEGADVHDESVEEPET